jgi:hypothetical protein
MNYFEMNELAKLRYKELTGELPKPQANFPRWRWRRSLARLFYSWAVKLEPYRYHPKSLAKE